MTEKKETTKETTEKKESDGDSEKKETTKETTTDQTQRNDPSRQQ